VLETRGEESGQLIERGGLIAGQPVFEVAPPAFDGIEFRRRGWEEEQSDISWQAQGLRFVKGAGGAQQEREAGSVSGRAVSEEEVEALGIEGGDLQKGALSGQRFDGPVAGETLEAGSGRGKGVHPAGSDAAADDGPEAAATFVLGPHAPLGIAALLRGLSLRQELGAKRGVEGRDGFGLFFGCERRGALGLARSL
jgi:hypothetical protein